jgi:hypothetical protein
VNPGRPRRPRNPHGWIIPKRGTVSRAIYECMMSSIPQKETIALMQRQWGISDCNLLRTMIYNIKYPDRKTTSIRGKQLSLNFGDWS